MSDCKEQNFVLRDVKIAYKIWHADKPKKVLALHGWLDNAASFDYLATLLSDYCIVAVDFAGQGLSEHRPASANYHLWDDVLDMRLLLEHLQWQKFILMGHSRGAMVATMLASSLPVTQIQRLILIDALMPIPVASDKAADQLRRYLNDTLQPRSKRYFESKEQAIAMRAKASNFPVQLAQVLAKRQLSYCKQGWYWHIDERLKNASALKLNNEHNKAFLDALQCPVDIFVAEQGMGRLDIMQQGAKIMPQFNWHFIDAIHHFHMTEQAKEIQKQCFDG